MPAAEIAGLAIGTIALASLFSTCVELFDLFELGGNCVYDYELACTKISILRERLRTWGRMLRVMTPGAEDSALRDQWPAKREIVGASLIGLRRIFCDSETLMQKYNLSVSSISLRRRTVWAIRDRGKFDRLIQDISFLVDGLEKITANDPSIDNRQDENEVLNRRESISDWVPPRKSLLRSREASVIAIRPEQDDGKDQSNTYDGESCRAGQASTRQAQQSSRSREHVVSGTQYNHHSSIGIQGLLGQTGDVICIEGIQINTQNALGIQGAASPEAVSQMHQRALNRSRFTNASAG